MRHTTPPIQIETPPQCPECGTSMVFTRHADVARDGRAHFVFRCETCAREIKLWRPEWQDLTDTFLAIEE